MTLVILPMLTMLIGFLMGVVTTDTFCDNKRLDKIERQIKRLERKMEVTQ